MVQPRSMHETSLSPKKWVLPEIKGLRSVQVALESDAQRQSRKYNHSEPSCASARFNVRLPRSPQNQKYTRRWKSSPAESLASDSGRHVAVDTDFRPAVITAHSVARFDKSYLMMKFRELDAEGSGFIKKRAFTMFLHEQLAQAGIQRDAHKMSRDLLKDLDANAGGSLHWDDFIEVFRKAGLLVEYQLQADVNEQPLALDLEHLMKETRQAQRESLMPGVDDVIGSEFRCQLGAQRERRFKVKRRVSAYAMDDEELMEL